MYVGLSGSLGTHIKQGKQENANKQTSGTNETNDLCVIVLVKYKCSALWRRRKTIRRKTGNSTKDQHKQNRGSVQRGRFTQRVKYERKHNFHSNLWMCFCECHENGNRGKERVTQWTRPMETRHTHSWRNTHHRRLHVPRSERIGCGPVVGRRRSRTRHRRALHVAFRFFGVSCGRARYTAVQISYTPIW